MVRRDPTLIELYETIKSDDLLYDFLRLHNLVPKPAIIGYTQKKTPYITLCATKPFNSAKPDCSGRITEVQKDGVLRYRCTVCKSEKSAYRGILAYERNVDQNHLGFFNAIDRTARPNRKISARDILYIAFCISKDILASRLKDLIGLTLSSKTLVEWELTVHELAQMPQMGGVGDIVEIDECYLKGRRKSNRGRYQVGNIAGHQGGRRNNYLARSKGPWLFGAICRRTKECRLFWVKDRKASTLVPIIQKHIAPGSSIMSDEWAAYRGLQRKGYHHQTVNHNHNFVDPVTGASTQMIERQWKKIKLPMLKNGPGIAKSTVQSHLSKHWYHSLNGRHVCEDPYLRLLDMVARYFPFE